MLLAEKEQHLIRALITAWKGTPKKTLRSSDPTTEGPGRGLPSAKGPERGPVEQGNKGKESRKLTEEDQEKLRKVSEEEQQIKGA